MMRRHNRERVRHAERLARFEVPPHAPPAVAEAKAEFDAVATRWAALKGDLRDAKDALAQAKQDDTVRS
jgi:hypothetical protein